MFSSVTHWLAPNSAVQTTSVDRTPNWSDFARKFCTMFCRCTSAAGSSSMSVHCCLALAGMSFQRLTCCLTKPLLSLPCTYVNGPLPLSGAALGAELVPPLLEVLEPHAAAVSPTAPRPAMDKKVLRRM